MKQTFYLTLFILILACSNPQSIPTIVPESDTSIFTYSDSTYVSDIRSIVWSDNYYISDYNRDQIVVLNENLKVVEIIGNKGEGPGEFSGLSGLWIQDDTIFAYNDTRRTLETFYKTDYQKSIGFPTGIAMNSMYKFKKTGGNLYFGLPDNRAGICKYHIRDTSFSFFGTLEQKSTAKETRIKNGRHILGFESKIISISDYKHMIELYDESGKLISTIDYSFIPIAKSRMEYITSQKEEINSYYNIVEDVYIDNSNLYLLIYSNMNSGFQCNTILQFEITNEGFIPVRIINLGNGYFSSICVHDNYLLTFDSWNGALIRYLLP